MCAVRTAQPLGAECQLCLSPALSLQPMLSPCFPSNVVLLIRHTLGGFYLARYEDSPAGTFDEVSRACMLLFTNLPALVCLELSSMHCQLGH